MTLRALGLAALLLALHGVTHARPGDLDPTFGDGGTVRESLPAADVQDVLVLADGSIVLAGAADLEQDGVTEFLVARLDASGEPVDDFGPGGALRGVVTTPVPLAEVAVAQRVALDPDGRIVVAGVAQFGLGTGAVSSQLIMARYFGDGELDREFGIDGFRNSVLARDVSGLLVVEDRSLTFVGTNQAFISGTLAHASGFSSLEFIEDSEGKDVVPHLGGVVMGGRFEHDFFLMRLHDGLNLDPDFGDAGTVRTPIAEGASLEKLLVLPDGGMVAVGVTALGGRDTEVALVRYTEAGAPDPTFGEQGVVVTSLGPGFDKPLDAVLAPDGTMLVVGITCPVTPPCQGFVARFLADGRPDVEFGDGGVVLVPDPVVAAALPDDGHLVVVHRDFGALVVSRLILAGCGNGKVEVGEECDDGNTEEGDCCSATCELEPDDAPCEGDGSACTADVCRDGECVHVVPEDAGCIGASASTLLPISDDVAGDRLRWTWRSTTPVDRAEFGDPTAATDVTACVVAGVGESDAALLEIAVPAAGTCGGVPCWKRTRRGFRFKDPDAGGDGAALLRLVTGANGSRIDLRARNLSGVADLPIPLRLRLVRHDADTCFEASLGPARGTALRLQ